MSLGGLQRRELTTDGEELVQDNDDVAGVSIVEDDESEQYMRAADMEWPCARCGLMQF